jgi:hypothetical protein
VLLVLLLQFLHRERRREKEQRTASIKMTGGLHVAYATGFCYATKFYPIAIAGTGWWVFEEEGEWEREEAPPLVFAFFLARVVVSLEEHSSDSDVVDIWLGFGRGGVLLGVEETWLEYDTSES